jgi:hypothetical protein
LPYYYLPWLIPLGVDLVTPQVVGCRLSLPSCDSEE